MLGSSCDVLEYAFVAFYLRSMLIMSSLYGLLIFFSDVYHWGRQVCLIILNIAVSNHNALGEKWDIHLPYKQGLLSSLLLPFKGAGCVDQIFRDRQRLQWPIFCWQKRTRCWIVSNFQGEIIFCHSFIGHNQLSLWCAIKPWNNK